ncbi:MAG TPA: PP2C family protein-serine/threonine phosphatase [Candidatus Limnocylindrales bacterium]|nr:PP2C family protein-serine/threonine phosphatase [Candidatus Limnocylindrales bacterium]
MLRDRVADVISGTVFLFIGFLAWGIAAMRRRSGAQILIWLGLWSVMDGFGPLANSLAALGLVPNWLQLSVPYLNTAASYLIMVVGSRAFLELTTGKLRFFIQAVISVGLAIALAGIGFFIFTGSNDKLMLYNNLLAACSLLVLVTVVVVPRLARKYLVLPDRRVLLAGMLVFAIQAVYTNLGRPLGYQATGIWASLGFAILLFSLGYAALQIISASERRLLSIENELAIAREIQSSILPSSNPELASLRITTAYRPMTAVAGDFYEFIPIDRHRIGVLVADVSGHGVPAALIAAMLKIAMQSVVPCAHNPREVLGGLNRTLYGQSRDQFVTAAYLFIDTQNHKALYSAAGHPPLLLSRGGRLERIESNGLVFGVAPDLDYPVHDMPIHSGDRFLLYTDGVIEPENAKGEAFGDAKLEQVVLDAQMRPPSELVDRLLTAIRSWQPSSMAQQDDITVVVIDVR